jgi:hypothetical protein
MQMIPFDSERVEKRGSTSRYSTGGWYFAFASSLSLRRISAKPSCGAAGRSIRTSVERRTKGDQTFQTKRTTMDTDKNPRFWTPAKIEILKAQWQAGASVRIIADMLGGNRNTVIGKARRLELPMHKASRFHPDSRAKKKRPAKGLTGKRRRKRLRRPAPQSAPELPPPSSQFEAPVSLQIAFADLGPHHCRYSTSPKAPFLFCGHTRRDKSAFCAFHHAICHEPLRGAPRAHFRRMSAPA